MITKSFTYNIDEKVCLIETEGTVMATVMIEVVSVVYVSRHIVNLSNLVVTILHDELPP